MLDALMREAERRKAALAAAPPPPPAAAKPKARPPKKSKAAAAPQAADDDDDDVLDLSAFMAADAVVDEEGSATSWGGSLDDDDDPLLDEGGDAEAGGMDDESEFLTLNGELVPEGEEADDAVDTWAYDSATGELVHRRIRPATKAKRPSAATTLTKLGAALQRAQAEAAARAEEEDDDEDDEDEDDDGDETGLAEELRAPTRLQRIDAADEDAVITALSGLSTLYLDKESQALLDQEVQRKKKARAARQAALRGRRPTLRGGSRAFWLRGRALQEREKKHKRVVDTSTAPPEGKRKTHKQLQIIAGTVRRSTPSTSFSLTRLARADARVAWQAANYKLWSPQDMNTRPMMAAVRGAVFSMLTAFMHGDGQTASTFPPVRQHARC